MPKLSGTNRRPLATNLHAPIRTTGARTGTHEGGTAFLRDAESELFLLAVTNIVGEDTFYERAADLIATPASRLWCIRSLPRTRRLSRASLRTCARRCGFGRQRSSWPPSTSPLAARAVVR